MVVLDRVGAPIMIELLWFPKPPWDIIGDTSVSNQ
jgi:hypothetical protein